MCRCLLLVFCWVRGLSDNPLAQASYIVAVRGVPSGGEAGVAAKGVVFQGLACFCVKD